MDRRGFRLLRKKSKEQSKVKLLYIQNCATDRNENVDNYGGKDLLRSEAKRIHTAFLKLLQIQMK